MGLNSGSLVAFLVAVSFAAGLNVYATAATLGLLARLHWCVLPPGLEVLEHTWVIVAGAALFCLEFVADKIPLFDVVWNAVHTFVRVPVAALLAYRATSQLSPGMQVLATVLSAAVATVAHTSKTGARVAVTPSPEPASNIALSSAEDIGAIGLTWVATHHPYVAGGIAAAAILAGGVSLGLVLRALARQIERLRAWFGSAQNAS